MRRESQTDRKTGRRYRERGEEKLLSPLSQPLPRCRCSSWRASSASEGGDVELVFASRWPEGGRGWRGGRKTRLQLGAKGYGRGDGGLLGLPEPRGQACGPHAWWGAFGLGLRVGQEFSYARKIFCVKALLISKYYRTSSSDKPIFC